MPKWIAIFTLLLGLNSGCGATGMLSDCGAPELAKGNAKYNQLVCDGIRLMAQDRYSEAAGTLEAAMHVPLFEVPNFELFPRLALAHFMAGNRQKAMENLEKADLSLSVLTGIIRCEEDDREMFILIRESGERVENMDVTRRMCGAAYDYIYERFSLKQVLQEAELVRRYFEIKEQIEKVDGRIEGSL